MKIVFHYLINLSSGNRVYYYPGEKRVNCTRLKRLLILSSSDEVLTAVCGEEAEKLFIRYSCLEGNTSGEFEVNPSSVQLNILSLLVGKASIFIKNAWTRISPAVSQSNREGIENGACDEIETYYKAIGMPYYSEFNSRAQIEVLYILGTHLHLMGKLKMDDTFFSCRGEMRDTGVEVSTPYFTGSIKSPAVYLRAAITNALRVQSR